MHLVLLPLRQVPSRFFLSRFGRSATLRYFLSRLRPASVSLSGPCLFPCRVFVCVIVGSFVLPRGCHTGCLRGSRSLNFTTPPHSSCLTKASPKGQGQVRGPGDTRVGWYVGRVVRKPGGTRAGWYMGRVVRGRGGTRAEWYAGYNASHLHSSRWGYTYVRVAVSVPISPYAYVHTPGGAPFWVCQM